MKNLIKTTFLLICSVFAFTASLTLQAQTIADLQANIDQNEADSDAADTTLGNRIIDETTARTNADGATRTGAGLNADGSYTAYTDSNYINEATSLHDADRLLDGALNSERNARIAEDALLRTDINSNRADIDRNRVDINRNTSDIQRNREGIAMVAAMTHTTLLPGNESAFDIGVATFESETACSINFARRVKEGVQVNLSAASTSGLSDAIVRGSIGFQW